MCGILGTLPATETRPFKKALDRLIHRGPDGYGIWQAHDDTITLGHRRLAILDLSEEGKQPMHYANYSITYNGEVYNFVEIRTTLQKLGFKFRSESDTEVILAAYQHWGVACLKHFNGMWAMAIWDHHKKQLFLARDRYGQKPLFYAFTKGKFIFASEMKAILPFLPEVVPAEHFNWCTQNIFDYERTDKCLIKGICRFPSGCYGYVNLSTQCIDFHKYWNTFEHLPEVPRNYEDQVAAFRALLLDACQLRMRSDVPIGTALSGGLDSSAIISAMAHISTTQQPVERVSKDWQHAFVATFPNTPLDERLYAQKVVDHLKIPATFVDMNQIASIDNLERSMQLFEEIYITSPVPMVALYSAIKKGGVSVSIDGHGADELLSGYDNSIYTAFPDCNFNPRKIKAILNARKALIPDNEQFNNKRGIAPTAYLRYMAGHYLLTTLDTIKNKRSNHNYRQAQNRTLGSFNSHLYELFHERVMPTLLRNYDRYSMLSSVEIRMPFLDHRVAAFLLAIPWESKIRGGFTKSILRDAAAPFTDSSVIQRKTKIGFNTPFTDWIRTSWKTYFLDITHSESFRTSGLIDSVSVKKSVEQLMAARHPKFADGQQVWNQIMPYLWEQSFLKAHS